MTSKLSAPVARSKLSMRSELRGPLELRERLQRPEDLAGPADLEDLEDPADLEGPEDLGDLEGSAGLGDLESPKRLKRPTHSQPRPPATRSGLLARPAPSELRVPRELWEQS